MRDFWKKKKILITGGAGFIGTHLANKLINKGSKVTVLDNLERGKKKFLSKKVKFYKCDLRFQNSKIKKYYKNIDIVFHLASKVGSMQYYLNNSFDVFNDNLSIDNNVIQEAINSKVKVFFYASSAHVYPSEKKLVKKKFIESDDYPYRPSISYGLAKMITENKLMFASKKYKFFKVLNARYTGIYGPFQDFHPKTASLIPAMCSKVINEKKNIRLLTDGKEKRSYCYIDDAINCSILMCEKNKNNFDTFNVCSNSIASIKSIAKKVIKVSKQNKNLKLPKIKANIDYQFCSNKKAINKLKWKYNINLERGIEFTYKDIQKRISSKQQ